MELFSTPAINLLGTVLVQARILHNNGDITPVTSIIPEFSIDNFFEELQNLMSFDAYEDYDEFSQENPAVCTYIYDKTQLSIMQFHNLCEIEIDWAVDMGIPPAFPRYIQGYELKV